ncbi:MAG: ZIP family metal transporter [Eudoraea sp.]|nr:ZIP family metal transporter [Eudoraea sp.]
MQEMWINISVLFAAALFGGLLAFRFKVSEKKSFDLALAFSGAYLFGITLVHIIPELFTSSSSPFRAGVFLLIGFFIQVLLEYLTSGVEHGHLHLPKEEHHHSTSMAISLLVGLVIHSVLEGTLLGQSHHHDHSTMPLLLGITFHKIPAAFAMMTVLLCQYKKPKWPILFLIIFALASPLGVLLRGTFDFGKEAGEILFALVGGSFLHISTTIVFESSPQHKLKIKRLFYSVLGAFFAILVQAIF